MLSQLANSQTSYLLETLISPSSLNSTQTAIYNRLISNPEYISFHFVSANSLLSSLNGNKLNISLPFFPCNNINYSSHLVEYSSESDYMWSGKFVSDSLSYTASCNTSEIIIIKKNNKLIGHITVNHESYELFDLTGGLQLICKSDMTERTVSGCGTSNEISNETGTNERPGDNPCTNLTTKLLVLYTDSAAMVNKDITGIANLIVAQNNVAWSNSKTFNTLILAGIAKINFVQSGFSANNPSPPDKDVLSLSNNATAQSLRNLYKADIVLLLTPHAWNFQGNTVFGISKEIKASANNAFVIADITTATNGRFTGIHEIGHVYGARHDDDPTDPVSKGFIFNTGCNWLGNNCTTNKTIMARLSSGQSRISHFSNSNVLFQSKPTGDGSHNNAPVINSMMLPVGNFVADPIPKYANLYKIPTGNDCSVIGFRMLICDDPDLFTFEWAWSQNGINNWIIFNTSAPIVYLNHPPAMPSYYVRCIARQNGADIYNLKTQVIKYGAGLVCQILCDPVFGFPPLNVFPSGPPEPEGEEPERPFVNTGLLENQSALNVSILPNPNSGEFLIKTNQKNISLQVFDILGKIIYQENLSINNKGEYLLDLKTVLAHGIYSVKFTGNTSVNTQKLIIE